MKSCNLKCVSIASLNIEKTFEFFSLLIKFISNWRHCVLHTLTMFSIKLTWLSGCAGGNGVYSLFTVFFFGSRRLARFLWRNLGRKRSQLCIRSSGSLDSSRLIISVWWFQQSAYGVGGVGWGVINQKKSDKCIVLLPPAIHTVSHWFVIISCDIWNF